MWPYQRNGMSWSRVLPLLSIRLRALTLEFLWFGSSMTMCLLGVAGWGRKVQLPAPLGMLAASVRRDSSPIPPVHHPGFGSPRALWDHLQKLVLQKESFEGLRPLSSLDLLRTPACAACLSREKGKELSPLIQSKALSALPGESTGTLVLLPFQQPGEIREVEEEALYFKRFYVIWVNLKILKWEVSDTRFSRGDRTVKCQDAGYLSVSAAGYWRRCCR